MIGDSGIDIVNIPKVGARGVFLNAMIHMSFPLFAPPKVPMVNPLLWVSMGSLTLHIFIKSTTVFCQRYPSFSSRNYPREAVDDKLDQQLAPTYAFQADLQALRNLTGGCGCGRASRVHETFGESKGTRVGNNGSFIDVGLSIRDRLSGFTEQHVLYKCFYVNKIQQGYS